MQENLLIRSKAVLGLPLTERERSIYLLYIASDEEAKWFMEKEHEINNK